MNPEEMTREELQAFIEQTVKSYFYNVDIVNQLNNYSRN